EGLTLRRFVVIEKRSGEVRGLTVRVKRLRSKPVVGPCALSAHLCPAAPHPERRPAHRQRCTAAPSFSPPANTHACDMRSDIAAACHSVRSEESSWTYAPHDGFESPAGFRHPRHRRHPRSRSCFFRWDESPFHPPAPLVASHSPFPTLIYLDLLGFAW